ncbi:MAG: low molecular weight protein-tyrosine-phosphatase [Solirubrobacteraceae bacterium]|jgi:protein-tyrosine phosphatase
MTRILFVCTGNICRSPMAVAVMQRFISEAGLDGQIVADSAGTGVWQPGAPPDRRAVAVGAARHFEVRGVARPVSVADFADFDLLVAMDETHAQDLRELAPDRTGRLKVRLLLADGDVPDPYYGSSAAFERALELIEAGCRALLERVADSA